MARRLHERANEDMRKAIEEQTKSEHYKDRVDSIINSNAIYNDDPDAIEKLKDKLERLEHERESIKAQEHQTWELTNIGARLEKLDEIEFKEVEFVGGKAIHNKEINRIQLVFDNIPNENTRKALKSKGFHWSRKEGAWQREFNENTIKATNILIRDVLNKEAEQGEEEFE